MSRPGAAAAPPHAASRRAMRSLRDSSRRPLRPPTHHATMPPSYTSSDDLRAGGMPTVMVKPWTDPVLDVLGHDPRSWYVETFWLPTLGPTCVLLMRHLADRFDRSPPGLPLDLTTTPDCLTLAAP